MKIKTENLVPEAGAIRMDTPGGMRFNEEKMTSMIASEAEFRPQQLLSLAERCNEAKKVFRESSNGLGEYWESFKPMADKMINDARMCRMAMTSELNAIKSEYTEIQKFLGSPNHKEMIVNLKELVDLVKTFVELSKQEALPVLLEAVLTLSEKKK
jgi:hypothetical protein